MNGRKFRVGLTLVVGAGACTGRSGGGWPGPGPEQNADTARVFAPGVVSRDHEFMATFTPEGRTVYVVRRIFPQRGAPPELTILESRFEDGTWSTPVVAPFSGRWRDIDPFVAPDGRRLYFNSVRPHPDRDAAATDFDIWFVDRTADGWGSPQRLPSAINSPQAEYFASVARNGTLYYTTAISGANRRELMVRARALAGGGFAAPETLTVVNTPADAGNPLISPDESFLLFAADRPGGQGDSDIYISLRQGESWSQPSNLGPLVNSSVAEFAPSLSPDGRYLFFTRMERNDDRTARRENIMVIARRVVIPIGR
jgi:hypothetical protein